MSTKEIARWRREEVDALLQAWREGLTHKPAPLRRGKLNAYVSDRFHALRTAHEPFRTACSIVYKKKYWKSMAQFICDYNEQSVGGEDGADRSDWFSLSVDERKRLFNKLKPTSYKFTDLEQDTVFEIARLIPLEDGTPDKSHLVYLSSSNAGRSGAAAGAGGGGDRLPGVVSNSMRQGTPRANSPANTLLSPVRRNPMRERRSAKHYDDSDDEDADDGTTSSDDELNGGTPEFKYPRSTRKLPTTDTDYQPSRDTSADKAYSVSNEYHYHQQEPQSATPDLMKIVDRLERQAQELKAMVSEEQEARKQARGQHEQRQQEWQREQEEHKRVLELLKGNQLESHADQQARQSEHADWAKVLQQLQTDREERIRVQAARSKDQEERKKLLEEMKRNQVERQRMRDQWELERKERTMLLEQISQERDAREQDEKEWRALLQQMKRDRSPKDEKGVEKTPEVKQAGTKSRDDQGSKKPSSKDVAEPKEDEAVHNHRDRALALDGQPTAAAFAEPKTASITTDAEPKWLSAANPKTISINKVAEAKPASTFKEAVRRLSDQAVGDDAGAKSLRAAELKSASTSKAAEPKPASTVKDVNEGAEVLRVLRQSPLPVSVAGKRSRQFGAGNELAPPQRSRVNRPRRA